MKHIALYPDCDNMAVGPFDSYDAAARWHTSSIYTDRKVVLVGLVTPRPDHQKNNATSRVD